MNTTVRDRPAADNEQRPPDWWHRDHPTFTALTGFFTGLAFVALVPGPVRRPARPGLRQRHDQQTFPMVLVALAVPLGLVAFPAPGGSALQAPSGWWYRPVVAGAATLVRWLMVQRDL